tara:strand:+ start:9917 stop:10192 length:276 start_codon:yes stop_codon:yes gene_type:complete
MIDIIDVKAGNRYTCSFTAKKVPLDEFGRPGASKSLADLPVVRLGDYVSTGELVARDLKQELVEVLDDKTNRKFVVEFGNLQDIEEVDAED